MKQLALFLFLNILWLPPSQTRSPNVQDSPYLCAANTLAMNGRLCVDITEVPGYMYKDYLASASESESTYSADFIARKPDFGKWRDIFDSMEEEQIENKFFESDEFALMPIIGISRKQAEDFCAWRTKMFQAELDKMSKRERAQFPKKFRFRLPTANEWSRIRFLTQEKRMMKQLDKIANGNLKAFKFSKAKVMRDSETISHIYNVKDAKVGFFNLFDNVAEMTSEEGIAVGGSWFRPNTEENYQQTFEYSAPAAWLGFRCVFEIID